MKWLIVFTNIFLCVVFATQAGARYKQTLRLAQTVPLPGVKGRLDHMGVDTCGGFAGAMLAN